MVLSLSRRVECGERDAAAAAFRQVLVVVDGSESARNAVFFAENWARDSGALVQISAPVPHLRNRRLVTGIADAARTLGADVIVLGLEHRRMARHRFARSFRALLARTTDLPVMIPPRLRPADAGTPVRHPMGRYLGV
jgi:nucleotide-binding universal stress UspA family protein